MKLHQYLNKHDIDPKKFAKKISASVSAISRWRNGNRLPKPEMIKKIMKATRGSVKIEDWYN